MVKDGIDTVQGGQFTHSSSSFPNSLPEVIFVNIPFAPVLWIPCKCLNVKHDVLSMCCTVINEICIALHENITGLCLFRPQLLNTAIVVCIKGQIWYMFERDNLFSMYLINL